MLKTPFSNTKLRFFYKVCHQWFIDLITLHEKTVWYRFNVYPCRVKRLLLRLSLCRRGTLVTQFVWEWHSRTVEYKSLKNFKTLKLILSKRCPSIKWKWKLRKPEKCAKYLVVVCDMKITQNQIREVLILIPNYWITLLKAFRVFSARKLL